MENTFKDEFQKTVTHWVTVVEALRDGGEGDSKACAEYRGRVYAARQIADMLGIEIDSNFDRADAE